MNPLQVVRNEIIDQQKILARNAYVSFLTKLVELSPHFVVNHNMIATLDANLKIVTRTGVWPSRLFTSRNDYATIDGLLTYRGVALGIWIDGDFNVSFKFPTINSHIYKIDSYSKRRWLRATNNPAYHNHGSVHTAEKVGMAALRLPTLKELTDTHSFIHQTNKIENHYFHIDITMPVEGLLTMIEDRYKKYASSLKKLNTITETSKQNCYKTYIKLRGQPLLDRTRASITVFTKK